MSLYAIKNDNGKYRDGIKLEWVDEISSHCVVDSVDAANDWNHTCANPLGEVVKLVEEPENGNITSEEAVEKVFREANRRVHNLISDDRFKFEIKMALNAYKHDKKPAPVVVSEAEDKVLKKSKNKIVWRPAAVISAYAYDNTKDPDDEVLLEDRLMLAYVNGWTVEKQKRYILPMEGTKLADGTIAYATIENTGVWTIKGYAEKQSAVAFNSTVTKEDIDAAPDWVKAITPVEVNDDEQ